MSLSLWLLGSCYVPVDSPTPTCILAGPAGLSELSKKEKEEEKMKKKMMMKQQQRLLLERNTGGAGGRKLYFNGCILETVKQWTYYYTKKPKMGGS